jgi:predicted HTH transcriptional regulator
LTSTKGRLTNAAVLLFTERPQAIFPAARLRIGVFKGTQILDTHDFERTLWEQLDGAMERFRRLLKLGLDVRATAPTLEGLQHREVWEYPLEALREAVTNALVHRDYAAPGDIQVRLLDDSLEIWNPGGLPEGIRLEQLRASSHPSVLRNPLIARASTPPVSSSSGEPAPRASSPGAARPGCRSRNSRRKPAGSGSFSSRTPTRPSASGPWGLTSGRSRS